MAENVELQPAPDVELVLHNKRWKLKDDKDVEKKRGDKLVIGAPKSLESWDVWFDPEKGPHTPDANNQVVINIRADVACANKSAVQGGQKKTEYKYTIRADGQIIDPKIIIDPPPP